MSDSIRAILLDIEGTTSSIGFVYETLFPYARKHIESFLEEQRSDAEAAGALVLLRDENSADIGDGAPLVPGPQDDNCIRQSAAYCLWLMDRDRKSGPLKTLQGMVWRQGFEAGHLLGEIYQDVASSLKRWRKEGRRVAIYSSGSVLAQRLLFEHTRYGDLTGDIDAFFDTNIGSKKDPESYERIVSRLEVAPDQTLFVSDTIAELDAAVAARLHVALSVRPGNVFQPNPAGYFSIHSFSELP